MQIKIDSVHSFRQQGCRDNQEDSRFPDMDSPDISNSIFAVCDGVGGCQKGEVASSAVCNRISQYAASYNNDTEFTDSEFRGLLGECYEALDQASNADNIGMGTTLTFIAFHSEGCFAAHIGDSRIYQIRPEDGIIYRSEDHSLVNSLLRSGNLGPGNTKEHPKSNVITRCMSADDGARERDDATVVNLKDILPGDFFLLCTDGVINCIDDECLVDLLSSNISDKEKLSQLSEICAGSQDNNTAMLIHIGMVSEPQVTNDTDRECVSVNTHQLHHHEPGVHDVSAQYRSKKGFKLKTIIDKIFR